MSLTEPPRTKTSHRIALLFTGTYAWATAVGFGMALMDMRFARAVPAPSAALAGADDLLLLAQAATGLAGLAALAAARRNGDAAILVACSLAVIFLGLVILPLLSPIVPAGSPLGPVMRLGLGGLVCLLAFLAAHRVSADR